MLALTLALRVAAMIWVPLVPEEAYYWMYAQNPALSYFDHPPMVAWLIGAGTSIIGDNEVGVRLASAMLMLASSVLIYAYGRLWFGHGAALLAAVALQVLPLYFGAGFIATMDSSLIFCWLVGLLGVTVALKNRLTWGWYLAGFGLGAGMLTKYTAVFIAFGAALLVIAHRPYRRHLRTVHPYLAILLAAVLFSPVIVWNANNDWASFRFQLYERFSGDLPGARRVCSFLLYQLAVATPVVLWASAALLVLQMRSLRRCFSPRSLITICFSVPLLAVMSVKSIQSDVHINWTLPAFLVLLPAAGHLSMVRMRTRTHNSPSRRQVGLALTAWTCVLINAGCMAYLLVLQPRWQLISAFGPWNRLVEIVEQHENRLERATGREPLIVGDGKYRLASVLAFYRRDMEPLADVPEFTTSGWIIGGSGLGFPYWAPERRWQGVDCIFVTRGEESRILKRLRPMFESVEIVKDPQLCQLGGDQYRLAIGHGLCAAPLVTPMPVARKLAG